MKGLVAAGGRGIKRELLIGLCKEADIVVAADSGIYNLKEGACRIDYLIGDFDSLTDTSILDAPGSSMEIIRFPVEKDKTDTELAIDFLALKGCSQITLVGAMGSRMDHTISNIYLLRSFHQKGISIRIIDDNNEISYLTQERLLYKERGYYYSILPIGPDGITVSLEGFHYPLKNELIEYGSSLGISNYLEDNEGRIIVHKGEGFLVKSKD
ncbi:MAG TPA: thiamine diphosphokinase [Tissierellaceae bacterium]|nr:thiamine diphosphokinase [Tissierellaceae bacterium]